MHPISDKDLDKLFQQRFEEAEYQPSEMVWQKIERKMDQQKKGKNSLSVFWMAAASLVLVVGAALWFYRPVEVIRLQGVEQVVAPNNPENINPVKETPAKESSSAQLRSFNYSSPEPIVIVQVPEENIMTEQVAEPVSKPAEIVAVTVPLKKSSLAEPNDQMKNVKVPVAYKGDQSKLDVTQSDMIASLDVVDQEVNVEEDVNSSKKIRSIGSLVNFVISKVDRRSDKIIEFKDGREGSEVSGINLGVVKLKNRIK